MKRLEDLPEYQNTKAMEQRILKLSLQATQRMMINLANQVNWHGPASTEWLETELADQERLEGRNVYTAEDHPIEDMFGSEICTGDKWFEDAAGRVILNENVEQYLQEVGNAKCYRSLV